MQWDVEWNRCPCRNHAFIGIPWRIDCAGFISAGLSTCAAPDMIVGKTVRGTGATICPRPSGGRGSPRAFGGVRVEIGGTDGEADIAGSVTELMA